MIPLLLATTNLGKRSEVLALLADLPVEVVTLTAWPGITPPEETGRTFAENARLKASYYARVTGLLTVAEDSGLEVDALDGRPGVQSARLGGETASDADRCQLVLAALRERGVEAGSARFVCALAVADSGGVLFESSGTVEGTIAPAPSGHGGFGYDPIFYYAPFGCTFAEAGARKIEVSHRTKALRPLRPWLEQRVRTRKVLEFSGPIGSAR